MGVNRTDYESNDKDLNFDFDEWVALFKDSPQAFEKRRLKWSEQTVNKASVANQRRLSGLLFQINMEKRRSKNALTSCIRISELMWAKFNQLNRELQQLVRKPAVTDLRPEKSSTRKCEERVESGFVYTFPATSKSPEE